MQKLADTEGSNTSRVVSDLLNTALLMRQSHAEQGLIAERLSSVADIFDQMSKSMTRDIAVRHEQHVIGATLAGDVVGVAATQVILPAVFADPVHVAAWTHLQQVAPGAPAGQSLFDAIAPLVEMRVGATVKIGSKETTTFDYLRRCVEFAAHLGRVDRSVIAVADSRTRTEQVLKNICVKLKNAEDENRPTH